MPTDETLNEPTGAAPLDATVRPRIPYHKRFLYRHAGNTKLEISLITRESMGAHFMVNKNLDSEKARKCKTEEDFFEATFHTASEFVAWIDNEWRNE